MELNLLIMEWNMLFLADNHIGIAKYSCEESYNINTTNGPLCSGRLLVESSDNGSNAQPYSVNLKPDGTKLYVGNYTPMEVQMYMNMI